MARRHRPEARSTAPDAGAGLPTPASLPPVQIAVLSAGMTDLAEMAPIHSIVAARTDLPGPSNPPDYGFWRFAMFMHALSRRFSRRGLRLTVMGNITTREALGSALNETMRTRPELVLWWTFCPALMPGGVPAAIFAHQVAAAAQAGTAVLFPWIAGIPRSCAGMLPVGSVHTKDCRLHLDPAPPGCLPVTPWCVGWGDWKTFREDWLGFALPAEALQTEAAVQESYTLPVWTAAAMLLRVCAAIGPARSPAELERIMEACSIAVRVGAAPDAVAARFLEVTHFALIGPTSLLAVPTQAGS